MAGKAGSKFKFKEAAGSADHPPAAPNGRNLKLKMNRKML
jgi:hypothetical protein